MNLSEHFLLDEMVKSTTATTLGISNTPDQKVINNLKLLCTSILEPARQALGPLIISSGYRSPELNKKIGGVENSAHIFGYAADVIPGKVSKIEFAKWVVKNVPFDQVILEFGTKDNPAWVHVSCDPQLRRQIFQILDGGKYIPITL